MQEDRGAASRSCCNQGMTQVGRPEVSVPDCSGISAFQSQKLPRMVSAEKVFLSDSVALPMN